VDSPSSIKVYIRNQSGYYLAKHGENWHLTPDSRVAHIFDDHVDSVTALLMIAKKKMGLMLTASPVDQDLAHEKCDVCGTVMSPITAQFDGHHFLCGACALAGKSNRIRC
jgi:hypothetical protein